MLEELSSACAQHKLNFELISTPLVTHLSIKAIIIFFTFTFWCSSAQALRNGFRVWRWNSSGKTWSFRSI